MSPPPPTKTLYLASRSVRRRELLHRLGVDFQPLDCDTDESRLNGERTADMAQRLAENKARTGLQVLKQSRQPDSGALILAADTLVDLDGEPLGKPPTVEVARQWLQTFCGRSHSIFTAVAVTDVDGNCRTALGETCVRMRAPSPEWIDRCAEVPEALTCAGGYAIQGAASVLVESVHGCFYNVVGLPLSLTARLLGEFGFVLQPDAAPER